MTAVPHEFRDIKHGFGRARHTNFSNAIHNHLTHTPLCNANEASIRERRFAILLNGGMLLFSRLRAMQRRPTPNAHPIESS